MSRVLPYPLLTAGLLLMWVGQRDRAGALKSAAAFVAQLVVLVAFSWREFGEILPPYYRLGLEGGTFSGEALAGLLGSPSRGLLVFSPLLLRWLLPQTASAPAHGDVDLVVDAPMDERWP